MNMRAVFRTLLLFITFMISFITLFVITEEYSVGVNCCLLLIFGIMELIFVKRNDSNKYRSIIIFLTLMNGGLVIYEFFEFLRQYMDSHFISIGYDCYYVWILFVLLIDSVMDCKRESQKLNDVLYMVVSFMICLVHYRYYLDPLFLHNLYRSGIDDIVLQNSYQYVSQYYLIFSLMLIVLFVHKIIFNVKDHWGSKVLR